MKMGKLEEKFMCINSGISRFEAGAINWELYASPDTRDELLMANPYHKGSDATVQSARMKTPRSIDLSVAAKRAVAQSESNLHWSRRNVQQLVEDVQFATHLNTFSCVSVVFYTLYIFHADGCT